MNINVLMDGKFEWHAGGAYSTHMRYDMYAGRFVNVFDSVTIHGRAYEACRDRAGGTSVTGPQAHFSRLPSFKGARQFLAMFPRIVRALWDVAFRPDPLLLYLPGIMPIIAGFFRKLSGKPYYALVVADPEEQLSRAALRHPLQPFAQRGFMFAVRRLVRSSAVTMYVTTRFLQEKYPGPPGSPQFGVSDVFLPDTYYTPAPREPDSFNIGAPTLVYVAMMAQAYKGHDVLLAAAGHLVADYPRLRILLVGDGPLRAELEALAAQLSLSENVQFLGALPAGATLHDVLDQADLFVMSSRAEGLPRALVEAMARGLPAIATNVGGIPELLQDSELVPPDQPKQLAHKIAGALSDRERLASMSERNLGVARDFEASRVSSRINAFYKAIRAHWDQRGR